MMSHRTPSYRLHRPTGRAVVTLNGRDLYLGRHGTTGSSPSGSPTAPTAADWHRVNHQARGVRPKVRRRGPINPC